MLLSSPGTPLPPQLKEGQGLGRERPSSQKEVGRSLPVGKIVWIENEKWVDAFDYHHPGRKSYTWESKQKKRTKRSN